MIILTACFSFLFTFLLIGLGKKYHLATPIRKRDSHAAPIPRLGGVAMVLSFLLAIGAVQFFNPHFFDAFGFPFAIFHYSIDKRLLAITLSVVVLSIVMIVDDLHGLRAYYKLAAQIVVSLIIIAGGIQIRYLNNPFGGKTIYLNQIILPVTIAGTTYHLLIIADLLAIIWLVMLMNVLNWIDGIDGLAGTIGAIALTVLGVLSLAVPVNQPATALIAFIGMASVLGFLIMNFPPAKIFMGDTGSMFLGFLIGVLSLVAGAKLATTGVVLAIPIIDAFLVIIARVIKKQNPFTHPDRSHLHHRFLLAGFSSRQTLLILGGISALFGFSALQNSGSGKIRLFLLAVGLMAVLLVILVSMSKRHIRD